MVIITNCYLQVPVIIKDNTEPEINALDDDDVGVKSTPSKRQTYRWISKNEDTNEAEDINNNRTTLIDLPEEGQVTDTVSIALK